MKTLQFTQPYPALTNYMDDLKSYARSNNVTVLDFANDPRLPKKLYMDILHLNDQGKSVFTEILAETLEPILH
jgi:lysophospholipase L1-like esterase